MNTEKESAWILTSHWQRHLDELLGDWFVLGEWFRDAAEKKFPGITALSGVKIECWRKGNEVPEWATSSREVRRRKHIPLGVWPGVSIYDEHAGNGAEGSPGDCAANLMARQLRINGDQRLLKLLEATRENDTQGAGGRFGLGALIKALHEANPDEASLVAMLAFSAFDAVVAAEEAKIAGKTAAEFDAKNFGQKIAGRDKTLEKIWDAAVVEEAARPNYLSLVGIVGDIVAQKGDVVALDWAVHVLDAVKVGKEIFDQACEEVKGSINIRPVYPRAGIRGLVRIALATSDSPAALRGMKRYVNDLQEKATGRRSVASAVLVSRRKTGNTEIASQGGVTLKAVTDALRAAEAKKRGWAEDDKRLFVLWHHAPMTQSEYCFNGSNTSPDVTPTALSGDEIAKLVTDTLCPAPACR